MGLEAIASALWVIMLSLWGGFWWLSAVVGAIVLILFVVIILGGVEYTFQFYRKGENENHEIGDDEPQLKCHPEYFAYIWNERKPFELRRNDRDFQEGDIYFLREYEPIFKRYTGRWVEVEILYILSLDYFFRMRGIENVAEVVDGYCVFGIRELSRYDGSTNDGEPDIPDCSGMRLA